MKGLCAGTSRDALGAVGLSWGGGGGSDSDAGCIFPGRNFLCVLLVLYMTSLLESPMLKQVKKGK